MTLRSARPILIAGGGPVGLVAALALARQGLEVQVFEAESCVDETPRAATTHPATLELLADLGLIDGIMRQGLIARTFQFWDRRSGRMIAEFDHDTLKHDTRYPFVVQCEQHKLSTLAIERLRALPNASVDLSSRVTSIDLRDDRVQITVETGARAKIAVGSYLIGADGGRSMVRKALGIAFEGYTFPERFLVLTTPFDFAAERNCSFRSFFCDPGEWANLFKVAGNDGRGLWRVLFPTRPGESDEQVFAEISVQDRLQKFFPKRGAYQVAHRNLYRVHQRVAASFRKGRAFLSGDAAHVNNPLGGLGLNCGLHDAIELARLLSAVVRDEAPDTALDRYEQRRRPINIEYVQQQTIANKKRLEEKDECARAREFNLLRSTAADPDKHRVFLLRTSLLESMRRKQLPVW